MNIPLEQAAQQAESIIASGGSVYQKFTCAQCGSRQTIDVENTFYTRGQCEECKHVTDLRIAGCGFMTILAVRS